ncbi:lipopolysaccharide biosynthesis protein [Photobacterium leiognathi]|uniref:lipopolysaccharide biosynthesis protein n=1 Tax=Photobacterium leiognathi TaxID=553611 RepID=UPI0029815907|nr:hypothetical protein [Photobacterium leiognathi]
MVNKSLIINVIMMYGRMLILMFLNLYISRLVLDYLGVEKYGLMSIVTSIVVLGSFLATVLETTAQRYISESLIKASNYNVVTTIQSLSYIYVVVITVSVLIVEIFGIYYVNTALNQKILTISELNVIFQMSVIIFLVSSINSILLAILIAFENVKLYSLVTLLEVFLKLIMIKILIEFDSSIFYYLLVLFLSILISRFYAYSYIRITRPDIKLKPLKNNELLKKISYFVRWNLIGSFSSILTVQGLNIIINMYQTLTVNAARAIATQLNLAILQIVNSVQLAFNPQVVKLYVNGDNYGLNKVFVMNSKLTAIFSALLIIVINSQLNQLLILWLGDYPPILNSFIYFMLIEMYFASFSGPLLSLIQASEKIKEYQLVVGGTMFLTVPICYSILSLYNNPLIIYYVPICINIICFSQRIYFVNKLNVVNIKQYIRDVFIKVTLFLIVMLFVQSEMTDIMIKGGIIIQFFILCITMFIIALTADERRVVFKLGKVIINKII